MRRLLPTSLLTAALVLLVAVPAFAHASFDITQVAAGATESYSLRVPIEHEAGNSAIAVLVPAGWTVAGCDAAEGWSCESDPSADDTTTVSLTRDDDAAGATERFDLSLTAPDEQGVYRFPVVQEYDDDTEAAWIEDPGADHPAPRIQVGDSDTLVERDEALPEHAGDATEAATETASIAPTDNPTADDATDEATTDDAPSDTSSEPAELTPSEDSGDAETDDDGSFLPVAVIIALVLILGGGAAVAKRRSA